MSQEIIEGIHMIEKEKGIEEGILISALEDALLAAFKKTPEATRHAEVKLDSDGEFRVYAIDIPEDVETRLVEDARRRGSPSSSGSRRRRASASTLVTDEDLDLDWSQVLDADRAHRRHPRRPAGSQPRPRSRSSSSGSGAERAIMYDEYVDRQGEVVTHRPAGRRPQQRARRPRPRRGPAPRSEQVDGERYEQGRDQGGHCRVTPARRARR